MKKILSIAAIGIVVAAVSAFSPKGNSATDMTGITDSKLSMYEAADTVPGKRKGDTAKHRYPKDTTRRMPPKG